MVAHDSHSNPTNGVSPSFNDQRAKNVGILGMEIYFPKRYVDQQELEKFDGVSAGKYTIGLGQHRMAFCDDREDINSICLTVVQNLLSKYQIPVTSIGRLEVGTETIIDKSKSVKTVLMQLFSPHNTEIEGIDTTNACYGGTSALFNAINWVQSESWDGRLAIVVAGDIAVYASGNARPTGGAGCVAILVGPDAPIVLDTGLRSTFMDHAWDFFKPDLNSEFPVVDGKLSVSCYLNAVDQCYRKYIDRFEKRHGMAPRSATVNDLDYFCFHSPYTKLVQKSFARLAFNDFLRSDQPDKWAKIGDLDRFKSMKVDDTYFDKDLEKTFMAVTKDSFKSKVDTSLLAARDLGNMYTGSLYGGLASLLSEVEPTQLVGKRIVLFSYGSGLASSMFSFRVVSPPTDIHRVLNVRARLDSRTRVDPAEFDATMQLREHTHNAKGYSPEGKLEGLFPGTYYIKQVDEKFRRSYGRFAEESKESSVTLVPAEVEASKE
ncbi:hydroxymethylglutaryl-CoA synthase [Gonapodya prolifera JEL478]|uniref:Hydroxymethylglutaryl-CoA synthase n=1 Tax=Gonapodya prolifera (strain JEL478) TaxID=1344416 RepID=A0A139AY34_GONPJ|nr:hydroxymethylglutaryl-CoA synthase [Gonapodya prolifera JEL478]|eukprot:KXS21614.1 hydroxymethylglutaryl-CoA synthase [Gonapodya prolifera JEL478]